MFYLKIHFSMLPDLKMANRFTSTDYSSKYRVTDIMELVLVEEGQWSIKHEGYSEYITNPGDIFITIPGVYHECRTVTPGHCHTCSTIGILNNFNFTVLTEEDIINYRYLYPPTEESMLRDNFVIIPFHFTPGKNLHLTEKYNIVINGFNRKSQCSWLMLCSHYLELISVISFNYLESAGNIKAEYHPASIYFYSKKILEHLNNCFMEPLDLSLLASSFDLSISYMCNIFKRATGKTIVEYLNRLRIEKAKELILKTSCNFNEICREVGINDEYYFSRLFKKYEGVSPKQYKGLYLR